MGVAHRPGVTLVFGTDCGALPQGRNAEEIAALEHAGVTPLAIRAAIVYAARAFGLSNSLGAIATGMAADMICSSGNPSRDIALLKRATFCAGARVCCPD